MKIHNGMIRSAALMLLLVIAVSAFVPALSLPAFADREITMESRKTPIMGWASWNAYRTNISEESILLQARMLNELGLAELGYEFVNIDDGWQHGRGEDGLVNINLTRFPNGMKAVSDAIHEMGLKAGIYTDAGVSTCGWQGDNETANDNVGLYGHDRKDLERYLIEWNYDFIKVDWCGGTRLGLSRQDRYTTIGKIIKDIEKETGVDKIYNVCCWAFPGEWVVDAADSWRTGGDINNNFDSVLYQLDNIKSLAKYNGPGHVNDLDMMQIGNGMTYEEDKSHFAMWCMMSTPLMLGMDLSCISNETLSIVKNSELIALDQDPACIQATVAKTYGSVEAWTKDLGAAGSGKSAIALLNRSNKETTVTVCFKDLGLENVSVLRDLWSHEDIPASEYYTATIPAHGTVVLRAEGTPVEKIGGNTDFTTPDGSEAEATMKIENKPASVNLTKLGKYDWVHFSSTPTRMNGGSGEISVVYDGSYVTYDNAAATYSWSNGDGTAKSGSSRDGIGVANVGAYIAVSTPCDRNVRTLKVAVGSFSANIKIEMIVGGKVIDSKTINGGGDTKVDKLVTMTYSSDKPTTAYLRWTVTKKLGNVDSVNVEGVSLDIDVKDNALYTPEIRRENGNNVIVVKGTCAANEARLHTVIKDNDGKILLAETKGFGENESIINETLETGLSGRLEVYLWDKNDVPLCSMKECEITASAPEGTSVGMMKAKQLISNGALLIDVRTPEEFEKSHIDGAVNFEYQSIADGIKELTSDKNAPIVLYCSAAKRSAQAAKALADLGYTAVYNLGSMDNYNAVPELNFTASTCKVVTTGDKVNASFTASPYDSPTVYISAGDDSTLADALPIGEFRIPEYDRYYLTLKLYLVQDGVCYAEHDETFIYWSEDTVDVFAADLAWKKATIGWGTIRKNLSVDGNKITLAGKKFTHGIGTHATSDIIMDIPAGMTKFLAVAGCDLEKSGDQTMMFFVYIDGVEADSSSLIKIGQHYVFDIDIPEEAKEIRLYAFEGLSDGNTNDHADWAVAGFFSHT